MDVENSAKKSSEKQKGNLNVIKKPRKEFFIKGVSYDDICSGGV